MNHVDVPCIVDHIDNVNRYLDAAVDAKQVLLLEVVIVYADLIDPCQAIKIDPKYSKAWARLAKATLVSLHLHFSTCHF
jgi:hypothetical protein